MENNGANITERQLCMLCWLFCQGCKHTGLDSWISAIADYHEKHDFPQLPRGKYYQRTKKSLTNIFGQIDVRAPAVPVSERQLLAIALLLDPEDAGHAEFWLGCLLGYQGLLRASEFCSGDPDMGESAGNSLRLAHYRAVLKNQAHSHRHLSG